MTLIDIMTAFVCFTIGAWIGFGISCLMIVAKDRKFGTETVEDEEYKGD